MFAEKEIEERLVEKLKELPIEEKQVLGSWATSFDGLRNFEEDSTDVVISVVVSPRQYDTAQIPTANIACAVGVDVRMECDPTGEKMSKAICAVLNMFQIWQDDLCSAAEAFTTPHFDVAGFRIDGGNGLVRDLSSSTYRFSISFTLRGVVGQ